MTKLISERKTKNHFRNLQKKSMVLGHYALTYPRVIIRLDLFHFLTLLLFYIKFFF